METPTTPPLATPTPAAFLAEHDAPCARCGYNLRGCTSTECPECGWRIDVARLARPMVRATRGMAIALIAGLVLAVAVFFAAAPRSTVAQSKVVLTVVQLVWWFGLVAPAVWWLSLRRRVWAAWGPAGVPAWAPLAGWVTLGVSAGLAWYLLYLVRSIVASIERGVGGGPTWLSTWQQVDLVANIAISLAGLVCYFGLVTARTPVALGVWVRRGVIFCAIVMLTPPIMNFVYMWAR